MEHDDDKTETFFFAGLFLLSSGSANAQNQLLGPLPVSRAGTDYGDLADFDWTGANLDVLGKTYLNASYPYAYSNVYSGLTVPYDFYAPYTFNNFSDGTHGLEFEYLKYTVSGQSTQKWKWSVPLNDAGQPDYANFPPPTRLFTFARINREAIINFLGGDDAIGHVMFPAIPDWSGGSLKGDAYSVLQSYNNFILRNDAVGQAATEPSNLYSFTMPAALSLEADTLPVEETEQGSLGELRYRIIARAQTLMLTGEDKPNANITEYIFHRPKEKGDGRNQFVYDSHMVTGVAGQFLAIPALVTLFGPSYPEPDFPIDFDVLQLAKKNAIQLKTDIPVNTFVRDKAYTLDYISTYDLFDEENQLDYYTLGPVTKIADKTDAGHLLYQGMPDKNSDFGNHKVSLWVAPQGKAIPRRLPPAPASLVESMAARIQTFFKPRDSSHPNPIANNPPNWLYYYIQVYSITEGIAYANQRTSTPILPLPVYYDKDGANYADTNFAEIKFNPLTFAERETDPIRIPVFGLYDATDNNGVQHKQIAQMGELRVTGIQGFFAVAGHEVGHNANARTRAFDNNSNVAIELRQADATIDANNNFVPDAWEYKHYFVKGSNNVNPPPYVKFIEQEFNEALAEIWALEFVNMNFNMWQQDWAVASLQWEEIPPKQSQPPYHPWEFVPYNAITREWGNPSKTITPNNIGVQPIVSFTGIPVRPN